MVNRREKGGWNISQRESEIEPRTNRDQCIMQRGRGGVDSPAFFQLYPLTLLDLRGSIEFPP